MSYLKPNYRRHPILTSSYVISRGCYLPERGVRPANFAYAAILSLVPSQAMPFLDYVPTITLPCFIVPKQTTFSRTVIRIRKVMVGIYDRRYYRLQKYPGNYANFPYLIGDTPMEEMISPRTRKIADDADARRKLSRPCKFTFFSA